MSLSIINWNIAENREWFVRLEDAGTTITIELYLTAAAAQGQTALQASGESTGYGTTLEITLSNDSGASVPVSFSQESYAWHLIISGSNGDGTKIFQVKEFVDLDEIAHPIYRTNAMIAARGLAEINAHTHTKIIRDVPLGSHLPTLEAGDIIRIQSTRRDLNEFSQIFEHRIVGTKDSLTSEFEIVSFLELQR